MTIALSDCILEAHLSLDVALFDASHLMPRWEPSRQRRDPEGIDRLFVHHSGALGRPGVDGAWASANYVVNQRKKANGQLARFPGPAYTYWIPAEPLRDEGGCLVVLRLNADDERSWHTGGRANGRGVSAVLQGNTTTKPLTESHERCLSALIPWCVQRHDLAMPEALSWHSDAKKDGGSPKKQCPGKNAEAWLRGYLRGYATEAA